MGNTKENEQSAIYDLTKRHDQALESARRLRTVAEGLSRASTKRPNEIRADAFTWQNGDGQYAEIVSIRDKVAFGIFSETGRPLFVDSSSTNEDLQKSTNEFVTQLRNWQDGNMNY